MKVYLLTSTLDNYKNLFADRITPDRSEAEILVVGGKSFSLGDYPSLKIVYKTGIGLDNLPFDEAEARGVRIIMPSSEVQRHIYEETACFTVYLILQMAYSEVGTVDSWIKAERPALKKKTVLIIGKGKVGSRVGELLRSMMDVTYFDIAENELHELDGKLGVADIVTLHLPLTEDTFTFIDKRRLQLMKDGAALVNTARGAVLDEKAFLDELLKGRLRGAIDVFTKEPYAGPFLSLDPRRLFLTPHVASTNIDFIEGCGYEVDNLSQIESQP